MSPKVQKLHNIMKNVFDSTNREKLKTSTETPLQSHLSPKPV